MSLLKHPLNRNDWADNQWDEWGLHLPQWQHLLTGEQDGTGRNVITDIEGDNLLDHLTKFHCIAAVDVDTGEEFYWGTDLGPDSLSHALKFLSQCRMLLGHNAIGYDYPAIEKLHPDWVRPDKAWDTMVIAKVIWPYDSLVGPDLARIRAGKMPSHMMKRHSLKAWGYRTGTFKGDYTGGFDEWCPAMAVYLMGDIRGTLALWHLTLKRLGWAKDTPEGALVWPELTLEVENEVAEIIFQQERYGVNFDTQKAIALAADLKNTQASLETQLVHTFGSWWACLDDPATGTVPAADRAMKMVGYEDITIRRYSEKTGKELKPYVGPPLQHYTMDAPHVRIEYTTFNPSSRDHLAQRLQVVFGWKPKAFGKDGKPTVDETTLSEIPDAVMPEATRQLVLDYFVVSKTLGTLVKGKRSWLGLVQDDGRIHGRMDPCGAVTRRGTHSNPNLSGTPAVLLEKIDGKEVPIKGLRGRYGWECRELFIADEGWELTGVDASSLELIDLGHYLEPADEGAFSARVCDPSRDAHSEHAILVRVSRADAKTTIYLFVYGGSAWKLSLDRAIKVAPEDIPALLGYRGLPMLLRSLVKRFDQDFVDKLDDMQKARLAHCRQVIIKLENGIPGLKDLKEGVKATAQARGWLKAIDGSRIVVRKPHAALNSLLQSAGAISCKLWMMLFHRAMKANGYVLGRDWKQVLWVHDELQITHKPGMGPDIKRIAEECLVQAGIMLGLRGRYRTAGKTGENWAECH